MASRLALIIHDHPAEIVKPGKGAFHQHTTQLGARRQKWLRPSAIVAIGGVHHAAPDAPARVAEHLALAAVDVIVGIQAALLAQARGQTLCASTTASEGVGKRPCASWSARLPA